MRSITRTLFVAGVTMRAYNFQHHNLVAALRFAIADVWTPTYVQQQQQCLLLMVYRETRAKSSLFHSHLYDTYTMHMVLLLSFSKYVFYASIFALDHISLSLSHSRSLALNFDIVYQLCMQYAAKGPWSNWKFISLAFSVSLITLHYSSFCALIWVLLSCRHTCSNNDEIHIVHHTHTHIISSGCQSMHAATHVSKFNPFRSSFFLSFCAHCTSFFSFSWCIHYLYRIK